MSDDSGQPGSDAPFLPPSRPTPPAPPPEIRLPDAPRPTPPPATETRSFSAKELHEATKPRATDAPAYGGLPEATASSAARIEALRHQAAKKRRRNRTIAWGIAAVLFAVVVAAGVTSYYLFQSEEPTEQPAR